MKTNISLAISAMLLLAVAYLFTLHMRQSKGQSPGGPDSTAARMEEGLRIVFVNSDSLLKNFNYYQEKVKEMDKKSQEAEAALQTRTRALERDFLQTQQKVQQGVLTPNQVQQEEQRLMQRQQSLAAEQEKVGKQLLEERQGILEDLEKRIKDILKALREERRYDYILNYGPGTGVLMVNDSLDITPVVLERLNATAETKSGKENK